MNAYITATGAFLPNAPVDNERMERVLGLVGGKTSRLRERILKQNGIVSRHYALDEDGRTTHLNEELAVHAIQAALGKRGLRPEQLDMLACGTTQGDVPVPSFASMVHGRLGGGPVELLSTAGVCCSGMSALLGAVRAIQGGQKRNAVVVASELVSRNLKASRFESESEDAEGYRALNADFLRWMLSDGAGSLVLENQPAPQGLSLRVEWIELTSHAHERPVCMYTGIVDKDAPRAGNTWLDKKTIAQADQVGMMRLRQDTRLLPDIVKLGVEQYLRLVKQERLRTDAIDHVLCHFSSKFFKGEIGKLLDQAGVMIPEHKWFTNLYTKGNTGAASIFIMLDEALESGRFQAGESVLLMVPESGRFQVAYAKLTVVGAPPLGPPRNGGEGSRDERMRVRELAPLEMDDVVRKSPLQLGGDSEVQKYLGLELALVWADFERMLRGVPLVQRLESGRGSLEDYRRLLVNLRQQVMEGARWIARAASSISIELFPLRSMFIGHAGDEHRDYQMLERDFVACGGTLEEITRQPKNVGSEALSAWMFHQASQPDPLDLLGAMFVIEGLGKKKAAHWAELLREDVGLTPQQTTFLGYHGKNDEDHLARLKRVIDDGYIDRPTAARVVKTAKVTARLYALQLEEIDRV
jgi:3-oxoacyl-[acyl-carrier-protein] synthase-3